MDVEFSKVNKHLRWLNNKLNGIVKNCTVSSSTDNNNTLIHLLKSKSQGLNVQEDISILNIPGEPYYFKFKEIWKIKSSNRNKSCEFKCVTLNIKLKSIDLLQLHWDVSDNQLYNPHWHMSKNVLKRYHKIHIPACMTWRKECPEDIEKYEVWLDGYFDFVKNEIGSYLSNLQSSS